MSARERLNRMMPPNKLGTPARSITSGRPIIISFFEPAGTEHRPRIGAQRSGAELRLGALVSLHFEIRLIPLREAHRITGSGVLPDLVTNSDSCLVRHDFTP